MRRSSDSLAAFGVKLALVGGITACAGCSCQGLIAEPAEAGTEGGGHPVDASAEGGGLAETGAALLDAGCDPPVVVTVPDGGVNPLAVGTWLPAPACCGNGNLKFAADPNASVKSFQWAPCGSQRPGCQRLVVDWKPWNRAALSYGDTQTVRLVNGAPYLLDYRLYSDDVYNLTAYLTVVEKLDGTRVFAAGQFVGPDVVGPPSDDCSVIPAVGERGLVMELAGHPDTRTFAWAPWSSLGSLQSMTFSVAALGFMPSQGDVDSLAVGPKTTYVGYGSSSMVVVLDLDQRSFTKTAPSPGVGRPIVVTDGAIVSRDDGTGLALLRPDATWTPLLTATPPSQVVELGVDRAAGQQIVWIEADTVCDNAVLWTTPYATTASGVTKRAVAAVHDPQARCGRQFAANAGVVLTLTDVDKAQVTRLSDGMGWVISAEPEDVFSQPLWVDDDEVWLSTGPAADVSNGIRDFSGIFRIARSSLGAPTVPPGL